jgi:hypothetical protein
VHSFCLELMPDFQPTSEVTHSSFSLWSGIPFTTTHDFDHLLQNTVSASRARAIACNVVCPISALGFKSPTLAQLMARYATTDPTLTSSTSDKRKVLSLVAPLAAKRKRTTKKVPVEVRSPLSWTQDHSYSDKFYPVLFQTRTQQPSASESANASPVGMTFITLFFFKDHYLHWHLLLIGHL